MEKERAGDRPFTSEELAQEVWEDEAPTAAQTEAAASHTHPGGNDERGDE